MTVNLAFTIKRLGAGTAGHQSKMGSRLTLDGKAGLRQDDDENEEYLGNASLNKQLTND